MRKSDIKDFVQCILLPLFVGGLAALFTMNSMQQFQSMEKPPLSPPAILFPIVWTLLYVLMGIASYLIFKADASGTDKEKALRTYGVSLIFNFLWPIFFFRYELYLFSFLWILLLWGIILILLQAVFPIILILRVHLWQSIHDSLSFVGNLCRLFKYGNLSVKPMKEQSLIR